MQSRNKKSPTSEERTHIERVKSLPCSLCGAEGPSEAHEIKQGSWFTAVSLCVACHRGGKGLHGDKSMWRIFKMDEVDALGVTVRALLVAA